MTKNKDSQNENHSLEQILNKEYTKMLVDLKHQIQVARLKAMNAVNTEMIGIYWKIGQAISEKEKISGWGAKVIQKLSKDLMAAFPGMKGFSPRNMRYMRRFYEVYPDFTMLQQVVAKLPWGHNIILMDKLDSLEERVWYANKTIENGWSRSVLLIWIENKIYKREGKAITNFKTTLTSTQSDLAQQSTRDPYNFQFLSFEEEFREKELEQGLVDHIQHLLMELGKGFAFVGRQYPINAGEKELYIDLLFYHLKLRCYVIVELKAREFDSRDAGQMSAYLSAVDDLLRHKDDNPSIGMILCRTKDNVFVEYVLRNFNRPIGVSEFEVDLVEKLPKELKSSLPTIKEIEEELEKDLQND